MASTATPGWLYLDGVMFDLGFVPHRDQKGSPDMTQQALQTIESDPEILSTAYMRYLPQDNLRSVEEDQSAETAAQAYENSLRRATQRLLQKTKRWFWSNPFPYIPCCPR